MQSQPFDLVFAQPDLTNPGIGSKIIHNHYLHERYSRHYIIRAETYCMSLSLIPQPSYLNRAERLSANGLGDSQRFTATSRPHFPVLGVSVSYQPLYCERSAF